MDEAERRVEALLKRWPKLQSGGDGVREVDRVVQCLRCPEEGQNQGSSEGGGGATLQSMYWYTA